MLEQAVHDWLEANNYNQVTPERQREMRRAALVPQNPDAEMPEVYRLWRQAKRWDKLWWPGGIANQPHILMMEFSVCEAAHAQFQDELLNMENILSDTRQPPG